MLSESRQRRRLLLLEAKGGEEDAKTKPRRLFSQLNQPPLRNGLAARELIFKLDRKSVKLPRGCLLFCGSSGLSLA